MYGPKYEPVRYKELRVTGGMPLAHPDRFLRCFGPVRVRLQARCIYRLLILSAPPRRASWREGPDIHFPDPAVVRPARCCCGSRVGGVVPRVASIYSDLKATLPVKHGLDVLVEATIVCQSMECAHEMAERWCPEQ